MRNHADTQQTASGTLTWHVLPFVFLITTFIASARPSKHGCLPLSKLSFSLLKPLLLPLSHPRWDFCSGRRKAKSKTGYLLSKPPEFPVDLGEDLNAPCLCSLLGHAGNPKDSPLYLIPCQKQSLWGSGARRASSPEPLCTLPPT